MAKVVLRDCYVEINGTNFSDHCQGVTITMSKDDVETTNFSGSGRERVAGLQDNTFEIELQQDYAPASTDAVLFPLWQNENEFTIKVRPTSAAKSSTNPEYSGTCILLEYTPLAGSVGDLSTTEVEFPVQRGTFARSTS